VHYKDLDGTPKKSHLQISSLMVLKKKGLTNLKPKIVHGIHEAQSSKQGELKNYLRQILEPTPTIVGMDVEIEVLCTTSNFTTCMLESIPLNIITTPATTKQMLKKINIIKKYQDFWFLKMPWVEANFYVNENLIIIQCKVCTKIKCKENLLVPKWNFLEKHVGEGKMNRG
jgi:hypothetical protein